jgi:hypothetical protein
LVSHNRAILQAERILIGSPTRSKGARECFTDVKPPKTRLATKECWQFGIFKDTDENFQSAVQPVSKSFLHFGVVPM